MEYDVTGFTRGQIDTLSGQAEAQAEATDYGGDTEDHPDTRVLRVDVVPLAARGPSKKARQLAQQYAALKPESGYPDMNAAITLAKALLRATKENR